MYPPLAVSTLNPSFLVLLHSHLPLPLVPFIELKQFSMPLWVILQPRVHSWSLAVRRVLYTRWLLGSLPSRTICHCPFVMLYPCAWDLLVYRVLPQCRVALPKSVSAPRATLPQGVQSSRISPTKSTISLWRAAHC